MLLRFVVLFIPIYTLPELLFQQKDSLWEKNVHRYLRNFQEQNNFSLLLAFEQTPRVIRVPYPLPVWLFHLNNTAVHTPAPFPLVFHPVLNVLIGSSGRIDQLVDSFLAITNWTGSRPHFDYFVFTDTSRKSSVPYLDAASTKGLKFKATLSPSKSSTKISVHSECFYCHNGGPGLVHLSDFQQERKVGHFPDFTLNFHGRPLSAYGYDNASLDDLRVRDIKGEYLQSILRLAVTLSLVLNFTGHVYHPPSSEAQLVALEEASVDFVPSFGVDKERVEKVTISFPHAYLHVGFAVAAPSTEFRWIVVVMPFSWRLWALIFSFTIGSGAVLVCLIRKSPFPDTVRSYSICKGVLATCRCLLEQHDGPYSLRNEVRLVLTAWWIFAIVVSCGYRGVFVSLMMKPYPTQIPESFEELAQQSSRYQWGTLYLFRDFLAELIKGSFDGSDVISDGMQEIETYNECFEKAIDGHFACIATDMFWNINSKANLMHPDGSSRLKFVVDLNYSMTAGIGLPPNAMYEDSMNMVLKRTMWSGLLEKWRKDDVWNNWWEGLLHARKMCASEKCVQHPEAPLTMDHLQVYFYGLFVGCIISFIVLCAEIFVRDECG